MKCQMIMKVAKDKTAIDHLEDVIASYKMDRGEDKRAKTLKKTSARKCLNQDEDQVSRYFGLPSCQTSQLTFSSIINVEKRFSSAKTIKK